MIECIFAQLVNMATREVVAECLQCPDGQYQDALGATICKSCSYQSHD